MHEISNVRRVGEAVAILIAAVGCAAPQPNISAVPPITAPCAQPEPDSLGRSVSFVSYVVDGKMIPTPVRNVAGERSRRLTELPGIPPMRESDIESVSVLRGRAAQEQYMSCPGYTVVAITTKRAAERR
jgi:hypothetical protein